MKICISSLDVLSEFRIASVPGLRSTDSMISVPGLATEYRLHASVPGLRTDSMIVPTNLAGLTLNSYN